MGGPDTDGDGLPDAGECALGNVIIKPAAAEPNVLLSGGTATFMLTVPRGRGTLQALPEVMVP